MGVEEWVRDRVGDYFGVNPRELELAQEYPVAAALCHRAAQQARDEATRRYPDSAFTNGAGDAFRHAYWNALMVRAVGSDLAERFADAHEEDPGQPDEQRRMDLHNNEVGRRIGRIWNRCPEDVVAGEVVRALNSGQLIVMGQ